MVVKNPRIVAQWWTSSEGHLLRAIYWISDLVTQLTTTAKLRNLNHDIEEKPKFSAKREFTVREWF